jgi:hypothetical protein
MRWIIAVVILMFPISAMCSPFLVCDPNSTAVGGYYKITGDSFWASNIPAQADGSIKSDVATIATGIHNINVVVCKADPSFGEACSATVPFSFSRLGAPLAPSHINIVP